MAQHGKYEFGGSGSGSVGIDAIHTRIAYLFGMPKRTSLYSRHVDLQAKLVDFGGFEMPLQYKGIRAEHTAVREKAGMFDVSHMGEFFLSGPDALANVQRLTVNDASLLEPGQAQYTAMCLETGGIVDDLIVYALAPDRFLLVVNAANIPKDRAWVERHLEGDVRFENRSDRMSLIALQGPLAPGLLGPLTDVPLDGMASYTFKTGTVCGIPDVIVSATGYTGEKGFELYIDHAQGDPGAVWDALLAAGAEPAGLGARDTLRLEMGYALYGNDLSETVTPLEGRLGWLTKLGKGAFIGREALLRQKEEGVPRRLVGFVMAQERALPRHGYAIEDAEGNGIGEVTSGSISISTGKGIGMGLVQAAHAGTGGELFIRIRNQAVPAVVTQPPFLHTN